MKHRFFSEFMRDIIFGIEDGLVSILGLVIGVSQATSSKETIIISGFAGAVAAAISMSAGNYLSTKSQQEVMQSEKSRMSKHVHPLTSAVVIGLCFLLMSIFPVAPYILFNINTANIIAIILTFSALFATGASKTVITKRNWFISGIEMVVVAGIAAGAGYLIGSTFSLQGI